MRIFLCVILLAAGLAAAETVTASAVKDGSVFLTTDNRQVRLLGVSAPRLYEPGGDVARDVLEKFVLGRELRLVTDGPDTDAAGRLLRYVHTNDTLVNAMLLRKGFATLDSGYTELKHADTLARLQATAARIGKGLWPFNVFPPPSFKTSSGDVSKYLVSEDSSGLPGLETISWADTDQYYGRLVRVVGFVVATYRSPKVFIMNFHQDYRRHFKAVVFQSDLDKFPEFPEDHYKKRLVRLTGSIKEYEGAAEMILNDPGQIEILE